MIGMNIREASRGYVYAGQHLSDVIGHHHMDLPQSQCDYEKNAARSSTRAHTFLDCSSPILFVCK